MALMVPYGAGGQGGELELLSKILFGRGAAITSTAAGVVTSNNHGLAVNNQVIVSDHSVSVYNGTWLVSAVTTNTFTLINTCGGSSPAGSGGATGFWCLAGMENAKLRLFSNNITPSETDVVGTYTETTFPGYTSGGVTLNSKLSSGSGWALPITTAPTGSWAPTTGGINANVWESTQPAVSWTVGTTGSSFAIYGYYVVGAITGNLWWAERFSATKNLVQGDTLQLTPRFGLAHYP